MRWFGFSRRSLLVLLGAAVAGTSLVYVWPRALLKVKDPIAAPSIAPAIHTGGVLSPPSLHLESTAKSILPNAFTYDLSTRDGRQKYYDDLSLLTALQLWSVWDDAVARARSDELPHVIRALGYRLRTDEAPSVYLEMAVRLSQRSKTVDERVAIVDALMIAASPAAVEVLLDFLRGDAAMVAVPDRSPESTDERTVRTAGQKAIRSIARTLIDGSRNWAIAPVLEEAWQAPVGTQSRQTVEIIGHSLAYLGKPEGVSALVEAAGRVDPNDPRTRASLEAIAQLRANDPVDVLAGAMQRRELNPELTRAIVQGLVSIGSADAAAVLKANLNRIVESVPELLPQVQSLIGRLKQ